MHILSFQIITIKKSQIGSGSATNIHKLVLVLLLLHMNIYKLLQLFFIGINILVQALVMIISNLILVLVRHFVKKSFKWKNNNPELLDLEIGLIHSAGKCS